jgi:DNA-binding NarL/FixJ family response regulator
MGEKSIGVLLVDDHTMVREGLASLLSKDPQVDVVGQIGEGLKVVEEVRRTRPDVVVLDIAMPGLNGLDICRQLTRKFRQTAVLILTMHDDAEFVARALEYGASGYLLKEAAGDQLTMAVRAVARGEFYLGPGISKNALLRIGHSGDDPYERLTPRERQVFQLIAEGKTSREISEVLKVAVKTIDTHRAHLMRKLDIHDRTSLVKYALRRGTVTLR